MRIITLIITATKTVITSTTGTTTTTNGITAHGTALLIMGPGSIHFIARTMDIAGIIVHGPIPIGHTMAGLRRLAIIMEAPGTTDGEATTIIITVHITAGILITLVDMVRDIGTTTVIRELSL